MFFVANIRIFGYIIKKYFTIMLVTKFYDEETLTQEVWYISSMIKYTRMVEDKQENKGNLYVTFNNGSTYLYKDVSFDDYMLLLAGGTDASQGKTLNKIIKPNYEYEKLEDISTSEIERRLMLAENKKHEAENNYYNTYFISGHREISEQEFEINYAPKIDNILEENPDAMFVVGDYWGTDKMAQDYLMNVKQINPSNITVYHMLESPRYFNEKITKFKGGYTTDDERDEAMTKASFKDIAFVRNCNKLSGTGKNILRRYLLATV